MFLRCSTRKKDGKEHRYYSIVENKRVADGRVVQRHVLYLGEINTSQELAWRKSIEVFEDGEERPRTLALFAEDRCAAVIPKSRWCGCGYQSCGCAVRANGVHAGWCLSCGESWSWIDFGVSVLREVAKGRAGIKCCWCWWPTG
jgi:hypothetical protein